MAAKPPVLPKIFTGDGEQSLSDWLDHFDRVTAIDNWDADAKKKWIQARLSGRVATAFQRLPEADRATFDKTVAELKKRFKLECYIAKFQGSKKRRNEDWTAFSEDLKMLFERVYPALQAEAQDLLALNQFLAQIEDLRLAFEVCQKTPITVDAAVAENIHATKDCCYASSSN